jgi:SMI1 / KNR4 family (SUKH-1)
VELRPPASEAEVADTEMILGVRLPDDLRGFLLQSNGASIASELDSGELIPAASPLVWSLNRILDENRAVALTDAGRARALYFANAGVYGILFGHSLDATGSALDVVVAWYPIEDRLQEVATSFGSFLDRWLRGSLKI